MFGEPKVQLRNESWFVELSEVCSGEQAFTQFVILFPGVVSGERKGLYYSVGCWGVMSWFLFW